MSLVVAFDDDVVDGGLSAFDDTHFEVDGVAFDARFDRDDVGEEVAVVHIEVVDGIVFLVESFFETFGVVDVATLHAKDTSKVVGGVDAIADPRYVADVVLYAFVDVDVDVDSVVVVAHYGFVEDTSIAIAVFIVVVDECNEVFFVEFFDEFFGTEEVHKPFLVSFFHGTVELTICHYVVAMETELMDFYFVFFVDSDVENDVVVSFGVVALDDGYFDVVETFADEEVFDVFFGTLDEERSYLRFFHYGYFVVDFFDVGAFEACKVNFAKARSFFEGYFDYGVSVSGLFVVHFDVGEETVVEVSLDGLRYFIAWDGDFLSFVETREVDEERVVHVGGSGDDDVVDDVFAGVARVGDAFYGCVGERTVGRCYGLCHGTREDERKD